ncbi:MAG: hypothetical protein ACRDGK_02790 [Actinomycetota bacterium]
MRVRRLAVVVVVGCLATAASASAASAVVVDRDTGYDPRDVEPRDGFYPPDVSSTTRRLTAVDGRRVLALIVRFHQRSGRGHIEVRLDSEGDRRVDHLMLITDFADPVCWIWPKGARGDRVEGRLAWRSGARVACRAPARTVHPRKSIRWKVTAEPNDGGFEPDHAPDDRGWYG